MGRIAGQQETEKQCRLDEATKHRGMPFYETEVMTIEPRRYANSPIRSTFENLPVVRREHHTTIVVA